MLTLTTAMIMMIKTMTPFLNEFLKDEARDAGMLCTIEGGIQVRDGGHVSQDSLTCEWHALHLN